jgi:hypothetical protein
MLQCNRRTGLAACTQDRLGKSTRLHDRELLLHVGVLVRRDGALRAKDHRALRACVCIKWLRERERERMHVHGWQHSQDSEVMPRGE